MHTRPVVLTIAGSDSGGGAGIQADLKTFLALGCHGLSAIAALTAQNTRGVTAIHRPPPRFLRAQLDALFDDFDIQAVKIGMLGSVPVIETVAAVLAARQARRIVLDPVMIATSGARLSERRALSALREQLLPLADVLTPNLPEAETLLGRTIGPGQDALAAAAELAPWTRGGILLKGGHLPGDDLVDLYRQRDGDIATWHHPRLPLAGHGTGCMLASAVAAGLAHGLDDKAAVDQAIRFLQQALKGAYQPGKGPLSVPDALAGMPA
ncbi:MAG: bifunctional hydroxymethylpyrimidine kinase/phosphomethylpyrimidine kinase [Xanthomonadales bacterium]|nr:bifunctional hydroxymethylpyrimidine kinase/phosphomethylpyrimidine kinase [Xanthomonadales bacterium]